MILSDNGKNPACYKPKQGKALIVSNMPDLCLLADDRERL